jgi:sRNA-binding regulator protein Hfq
MIAPRFARARSPPIELIRGNQCDIYGEKTGSDPDDFQSIPHSPLLEPGFHGMKGIPVDSPNRKLIRPSFNEMKEKMEQPRKAQQKRPTPPDQTNAENFYYVKQMQAKTPMVITLKDGEVLKGSIEWYDRSCLKVNRDGEPNVLVYKSNIKYMYKDE